MTRDLDNEVLIALRRLIAATELDSKNLARSTGLTTSQLLVLDLLAHESELTVSAVASRVGLAQGSVTTIIDRLETQGLVSRRRDETDRRQVRLVLTEEGSKRVYDAPIVLQTRFLRAFGTLRDWEKHGILAALQRLVDLMDVEELAASPILEVGAESPASDRSKGA